MGPQPSCWIEKRIDRVGRNQPWPWLLSWVGYSGLLNWFLCIHMPPLGRFFFLVEEHDDELFIASKRWSTNCSIQLYSEPFLAAAFWLQICCHISVAFKRRTSRFALPLLEKTSRLWIPHGYEYLMIMFHYDNNPLEMSLPAEYLPTDVFRYSFITGIKKSLCC